MPCDRGLRVLLNPAGIDDQTGPAFLARCFATRWSDAMFRWYLQRPFGGEPPDRVILTDGAHAVAACGLAYRNLRTPDGEVLRVSVVVAACTLPSARGRGCYARVLEAAIQRSAARGCAALLGFVTADNATGRGLRRLGAAAIPSAYIVSRDRAHTSRANNLRLSGARVTDDWPVRAARRVRGGGARAAFDYPDAQTWRSQMVDRPHGVQAVRIGATCRALIEGAGDTDRLQWLDGEGRERAAAIRTVAARAAHAGRRFFMYSTCPQEAAAAQRLGLALRPGYMMALAVQQHRAAKVRTWPGLSWLVQSGDRL
ncbi:MAG TPA: hypothetical protein VET46_14680 [Steroidobacteraceae bacterium]|nr:hypothetical protein [Steroidobacteraceae bacterium]